MSAAKRNQAVLCAAVSVLLCACSQDVAQPAGELPRAFSVQDGGLELQLALAVQPQADLGAFLGALNQELAAQGIPYAVPRAELLLAVSADPNRASTVFANDRQHSTGNLFVAGDPRRGTVGNILRQASFLPFSVASTGPGTTVPAKPSVDASFATWSARPCSSLEIVNNTLPANVFPSAILNLTGFIRNPLLSDVNTVGFLPGAIFDIVLGPGASTQVLGVTFPFVFTSGGVPTDIDGDGNADSAFAEIWYNNAFRWTNTGTGPNVDIETVTLHENGHALGLGHFGKIAINNSNGKLKVSPRAVMNALVLGTLRQPLGTDNGSFCDNWENWPQ